MTTYMPEDKHRWFDLRKFHSWSTEGEVFLCLAVMLHCWVMGLISRPHSGLIFHGLTCSTVLLGISTLEHKHPSLSENVLH